MNKFVEDSEENSKFKLEEAIGYINLSIHHINVEEPSFQDIGVIVGVLAMNDEVEVVVKFHNRIIQLTKRELLRNYMKEIINLNH